VKRGHPQDYSFVVELRRSDKNVIDFFFNDFASKIQTAPGSAEPSPQRYFAFSKSRSCSCVAGSNVKFISSKK
jgi:hypothetical protein